VNKRMELNPKDELILFYVFENVDLGIDIKN